MMKQVPQRTRAKAKKTMKRTPTPEIDEKEQALYRAAILHLIRKVGGLFVATAVREISVKGFKLWIFTVTMRYPTGHEGYIGELLYDGENFTMLTPDSVIDERVAKIAAHPERDRKWNEYRASTLQAGQR